MKRPSNFDIAMTAWLLFLVAFSGGLSAAMMEVTFGPGTVRTMFGF